MPKPPSEAIPEVEAALARQDVRALQALAGAADKRIAKAAKRALHKLRARGVSIPEAPAAPTAAHGDSAHGASPREAFLATSIDGQGERAVFLPLKAPLGFVLHLAVLSDESGILDLTSRQLSRRQLRAFLAGLTPETRAVLREIPAAKAAALLSAAIELSPGSASLPAARELLRALDAFAGGPDDRGPESGATRDDGSIGPTPEQDLALRDSALLFEAPALRGYLPPQDAIASTAQKLEEVVVSPLLIDESQRRAQMGHALEQAASDFFTPLRRALYGARLLDAAELFSSHGDRMSAARARAASAALSGDRPIQEIPFARAMFERIFDLDSALKKSGRAESEAGRSPGGLISS